MGSTPNGRIRIFFLRGLRHWMEKRKKNYHPQLKYLRVCDNRLSNSWVQVVFLPHRGEEKKMCHFRNDKGTGAEMSPANVSGIVTRDALVSYWPDFPVSMVTVPEVFAKVNLAQISFSSKAQHVKYSFT